MWDIKLNKRGYIMYIFCSELTLYPKYIVFTIEKTKVEIFKKIGSEIGKKAAEKSGGLFSADDWHCSR